MIAFISDTPPVEEGILDFDIANFELGGAAQDDSAMLHYLSKRVGQIKKLISREVTPEMISEEDTYIVGNFIQMTAPTMQRLINLGNYILYEHDHKYCVSRNPAIYRDNQVPPTHLANLPFYLKAKCVVCMTKLHQQILERNVQCNVTNIGGTFFFQEELDLMRELTESPKASVAAIYGHPHPWKGMQASVEHCLQKGLRYSVIGAKPTRREFLEELAKFDKAVYLPGLPETCCRFVVEAKMMGAEVITTPLVGAALEDWYKLPGTELIDFFEKELHARGTDIIYECLH